MIRGERKICKLHNHGNAVIGDWRCFSICIRSLEDDHIDSVLYFQGDRHREGTKAFWRHFLVLRRHDFFLHIQTVLAARIAL